MHLDYYLHQLRSIVLTGFNNVFQLTIIGKISNYLV